MFLTSTELYDERLHYKTIFGKGNVDIIFSKLSRMVSLVIVLNICSNIIENTGCAIIVGIRHLMKT